MSKGHFEAVPVPAYPGDESVIPGQFIAYRTLDPIRAAALQAAVALAPAVVAQGNTVQPGEMVDWAKAFEQYLTGEEADGQG